MYFMFLLLSLISVSAQAFDQSTELQVSQIFSLPPGRERVLKIDEVLRKLMSGRLEEDEPNRFAQLLTLRSDTCKRNIPECSNIAALMTESCSDRADDRIVGKGGQLWTAILGGAPSEVQKSQVFDQIKKECSRPTSSKAFMTSIGFVKALAPHNSALFKKGEEWILSTWKVPPKDLAKSEIYLAEIFASADFEKPQGADVMTMIARVGAQWVKSSKKPSEFSEGFLRDVVARGLTTAAMSAELSALSDLEPLKSKIAKKSAFTASILDSLCEVWIRTAQLPRCQELIGALLAQKDLSDQFAWIESIRLRVLHFQGKLAEAQAAGKALLAKSSKDPNDLSSGWTHFLLSILARDLGQLKEAHSHLDQHVRILSPLLEKNPSLKMMGDNLRMTILTREKRFVEAMIASDLAIKAVNKNIRGSNQVEAWVYYDRYVLALLSRNSKEKEAAMGSLIAAVKSLPSLEFLKDLALYQSEPTTPAGKLAMKKAEDFLGTEHPTIKYAKKATSQL